MNTQMPIVKLLTQLTSTDLHRLITGYASDAQYCVHKTETDGQFTLTLTLVPLAEPHFKRYDHTDEETVSHYQQVLQHGFSFGAFEGEYLVGIALAEPHTWNSSLWVWEFHVAATHQRQGIGRQLMAALVQKGQAAGLRTIVCETQTTNVPAIRFYQSAGFHIEGIDLSYYTNDDYPDGEIALFMKRRLL